MKLAVRKLYSWQAICNISNSFQTWIIFQASELWFFLEICISCYSLLNNFFFPIVDSYLCIQVLVYLHDTPTTKVSAIFTSELLVGVIINRIQFFYIFPKISISEHSLKRDQSNLLALLAHKKESTFCQRFTPKKNQFQHASCTGIILLGNLDIQGGSRKKSPWKKINGVWVW